MIVLGIETSCDETGVAIYNSKENRLLSNELFSQIDMHKQYGGVVPELASRDHLSKLMPLTRTALTHSRLALGDIEGIAYTAMPGLLGTLLVGAAFAKALSYMLDVPAIGIHHLEGHMLSPLLDNKINLEYPYVALLVSGGHTQLLSVRGFNNYEILGESVDDAAGEAFDKVGKLLGLPYPGGPHLSRIAKRGCQGVFYFPRPMVHSPNLNFSFSGLKTAVFNTWKKLQNSEQNDQTRADIAYAFQEALVDSIVIKCKRALQYTGFKNLVISGGVSANTYLRSALDKNFPKKTYNIYYPPLRFCSDNGAMIAIAGAYRLLNGYADKSMNISVYPRFPLSNMNK